MHGDSWISSQTIWTVFTDAKEASSTIRTGFTDRCVLCHNTWELNERHFLMDKSLYKRQLARLFGNDF